MFHRVSERDGGLAGLIQGFLPWASIQAVRSVVGAWRCRYDSRVWRHLWGSTGSIHQTERRRAKRLGLCVARRGTMTTTVHQAGLFSKNPRSGGFRWDTKRGVALHNCQPSSVSLATTRLWGTSAAWGRGVCLVGSKKVSRVDRLGAMSATCLAFGHLAMCLLLGVFRWDTTTSKRHAFCCIGDGLGREVSRLDTMFEKSRVVGLC